MLQLDEKTQALLKQKGLRCICEICDCGRPHKHNGCTKKIATVKSTLQRNGKVKSDYQEAYGQKGKPCLVQSMKPMPSKLNPNPPGMDFRTTNRLHFKNEKSEGRAKPCTLTSEYEGLTGPFYGDSVYRVDYPGHKPDLVKMERPKTQKVQRDIKLDASTMYNNAFQSKQQDRQEAFQELPSFAYSILYPDRSNPIDKISFKNAIHAGKFAARPDLLAPKESTVKIGREGSYEHATTNREAYMQYADFQREKPFRSGTDWKPRPKFQAKTQAQDDFKGYGGNMPLRRKAITPPPETINLAADRNRYLETTKDSELKITWEKNKLHRPPMKKVLETYSPPKDPLEALSVMQADYKKHENVRPAEIKPLDQPKTYDASFSHVTSYGSQFPAYGRVDVSRHGDAYDKHYYTKPFNKFVQDDSTMRGDYKSYGNIKRVEPIVPENKRHAKGGQFYGETSYSEEYKPKALEPCAFTKLLAAADLKTFQSLADDVIRTKPSPLPAVGR